MRQTFPPENASRPPCRFPCASPCGVPSCPGFPRFVTPGQAAYAGSGFAPSSADYNTTPGERIQRRFGSFCPRKRLGSDISRRVQISCSASGVKQENIARGRFF